jgi:thiol:disulfide interchange protein DsbG
MFRLSLLAAVAAVPAWASGPLCAVPAAGGAPPPPVASTSTPTALSPELAALPFLRHVAAAGAVLQDLGTAYGLRSVVARTGDEFMLFQVTPLGDAAVAGAIALLSPEQLRAMAPGGAVELPERHGLRGLFVRSGQHFQVFYVTPDGQRVVPGVLWGADGQELTRAQVAGIPGAVPTVMLGDVRPGEGAAAPSALSAMARAHAGQAGAANAPLLWMLADPRCTYSVRAMQVLQPLVAAGRVRVAVVPVAVLDREPGGQSAQTAAAMLSEPPDRMVGSWQAGRLAAVATAADAGERLRQNMAVADAVGLRGTPTFFYRRHDGSEGRLDGMPTDVGGLVASLGR